MPTRLAGNPGFVPEPGTSYSGQSAEVAKRLDTLAKKLGVVIYGISGDRTPAHSVEVGGFANDPHVNHQAIDVGVGSLMRSSAGQLTAAQLASVGLERPFSGSQEINHIQLKTSSGGGGGILKTLAGLNPVTAPAVIAQDITSGNVPGAGILSGAESAAGAAASAVQVLTDPRTWIRVAEVLIGAALLLMGIKSFTGGTIDPVGAVARRVP